MLNQILSQHERGWPLISCNGRDLVFVSPQFGAITMYGIWDVRSNVQCRSLYAPINFGDWMAPMDYVCNGHRISLDLHVEGPAASFSKEVTPELRQSLLRADELSIIELLKIVHDRVKA